MTREEKLKMLAQWIEEEASEKPDPEAAEPYREAGDRLVDDALGYID